MKKLLILLSLLVNNVFANQWANYMEFEVDATNAIANINILMSDSYTNRLHLLRNEVDSTNEMFSAALLMLALSDDAKSNHIEEFIGNTNCLIRVSWFLTCSAQERTLWQKICAITMLSTSNKNPSLAADYFDIAVNALHQWDLLGTCYSGGELYCAIARYFGAAELNPRQCAVLAAAISAKRAGMMQQYNDYFNLLPIETREFIAHEN